MVHLEKINGIPDEIRKNLPFEEIEDSVRHHSFYILVNDNGNRINDSYYDELDENHSSDSLFVLKKYEIKQFERRILKMSNENDWETMNPNYLSTKNCVIDPSDGYEYYIDKDDYTSVYIKNLKNLFVITYNVFNSKSNNIIYSKLNHSILHKTEENTLKEEINSNKKNMFVICDNSYSNQSTFIKVIDLEKAEIITVYDSDGIHNINQ